MPGDKDENGKILTIINMIRDDISVVRKDNTLAQNRIESKVDRNFGKIGEIEKDLASLPCDHVNTRIVKLETDTQKNTELRWTLKTLAVLIGTPSLVTIILTLVISLF